MKKRRQFFILSITFIFLLLSLSKLSKAAEETTLLINKTARGGWEKNYSWSIQKSVTPQTLELSQGQSREAEYLVNVFRHSGLDKYWVEGEIVLTNGVGSTEGLQIIEQVQYRDPSGNFKDLPNATLTLAFYLPQDQLKPHEQKRFPYRVAFTPVEGAAAYRTVSKVTITNYLEYMYERYGPEMILDFKLPPTQSIVNESVNVDDTNGYSWVFSDSGSKTYSKSFSCDQDAGKQVSTATIRETGLSSSVILTVNCLSGQVVPQTIDHWKNHPKEVTALLPVQLGEKQGSESIKVSNLALAVDILAMETFGRPHNFITKLYAQMLAAKLNLKNGADSTPSIEKLLKEADNFISKTSYKAWKSLAIEQKNMLNYWINQLDNYNNGNL